MLLMFGHKMYVFHIYRNTIHTKNSIYMNVDLDGGEE